jgi:hypothetical protein
LISRTGFAVREISVANFMPLVCIAVPKITLWRDMVAQALLQLFDFRETSLRLSIPDQVAIQAYAEGATRVGRA